MNRARFHKIVTIYICYGFKLLFPIVFIFVATRKLAAADVAKLVTAQSVAWLSSQMVEYGFSVYGVRHLTEDNGSESRTSSLVSSIISAQLILAALSAPIVFVLASASSILEYEPNVCGPVWMYAVLLGMNFGWYYQGTYRVVRFAIIDASSLLVCTLALYAISELATFSANQMIWMLVIAPALSQCICFNTIRRETVIEINFTSAYAAISHASNLFAGRAAATSYTAGAVWLASLFAKPNDIAEFGSVMRVLGAATNVFTPAAQLLLPKSMSLRLSSGSDRGFFLRSASLLLATLAIALIIILEVFSGPIAIKLLHDSSLSRLIESGAWMLLPIAGTVFLSTCIHLPSRRDKLVARVGIFAAGAISAATIIASLHYGSSELILVRVYGELLIFLWSGICAIRYRKVT